MRSGKTGVGIGTEVGVGEGAGASERERGALGKLLSTGERNVVPGSGNAQSSRVQSCTAFSETVCSGYRALSAK